MNKKLVTAMFAAFLIISGCSSNEGKDENTQIEQKISEENSQTKNQNKVEALTKEIEKAEEVKEKENDYTEDSYVEYKKAVDNAKKVKENKKATEAEVETALNAIKDAKKVLEKKQTQTNTQTKDKAGTAMGKVSDYDSIVVNATFYWLVRIPEEGLDAKKTYSIVVNDKPFDLTYNSEEKRFEARISPTDKYSQKVIEAGTITETE